MSRGEGGGHGGGGSTGSMSFNLGDGPANALALSKDNSHVVVAGRNGKFFLIVWKIWVKNL